MLNVPADPSFRVQAISLRQQDSALARGLLTGLFVLGILSGGFQIAQGQDVAATVESAPQNISPEAAAFFETRIRPLLVESCYKCHGEGKHKGNLQLDGRAHLLAGGDSGPAIVPGNPAESVLIQAINYESYEMPPGQKLSAEKIADLTKWVAMGAPWPGSDGKPVAPVRKKAEISEEDRQWWAFQPIVRPELPLLHESQSPRQAIDSFILAALEEQQLTPNAPAPAHTLVRRAYFDLIGLPPTPEDMQLWTAQLNAGATPESGVNQAAWAQLIESLLARPQYGERWGRHWLDVVRFAQTNGYERDSEKAYAWRYRDYVVNAFNADTPYDRFVLEQLAGDELPDADRNSRIATGFYRLGLWDDEPDDAQQAEFDDLDDTMVATSAAFLGLTMGCARCHDHKFDPILHRDYYALLAFFRNVRRFSYPDDNPEAAGLLPISDSETFQAALKKREQRRAELTEKIAATEDKQEKERLERQKRDESLTGVEWALAVRENGKEAPETRILIRGNAQTPGEAVEPCFPQVLGGTQPTIRPPERDAPFETSGRRLAFARWLVDGNHPLTARVLVNRIWHYHFGRGIVPTTSDFGKAGVPPTHPELLDWLAATFMDDGWSIKSLHRRIMLSQAYQRSSANTNVAAIEKDPGNTLLWRQNLHRLEAEAIRDSLLAVSGQLNLEQGGRGFFPQLEAEVLAGGTNPGSGWELSSPQQRNRRSLYTFIKRSLVSPQLDTFDYANTALPLTERPTTTVAPQALMLLNDDMLQQQSRAFAQRIVGEAGGEPTARIRRAFEIALTRLPTPEEIALSGEFIEQQRGEFAELRTRMVFRPLVPTAIAPEFFRQLSAKHFIQTPETGWMPVAGKWKKFTRHHEPDLTQGPASLWTGAIFEDAVLSGRITLGNASELATILLRASPQDSFVKGYEIVLSPRHSLLSIVRHAGEPKTLAEVEVPIPTGEPLAIRCEISGGTLSVQLGAGDSPTSLTVTDAEPVTTPGQLGIRTWGAALTLDDLTLHLQNREFDIATAQVDPGKLQSPESSGWSEFAGNWTATPAGTLSPRVPTPGAKLIWNETQFADGLIEADVKVLGKGDAGLIVRVNDPRLGGDALNAYNINFSELRLRLGKHQQNWRELVSVEHEFPLGQWKHLRAEFLGPRIRIFIDQEQNPLIDYVDPQPLPAGRLGFRTYRCPVEFRNFSVSTPAGTLAPNLHHIQPSSGLRIAVTGNRPDDSEQRAFQAFCLLILNLNEMIYIE